MVCSGAEFAYSCMPLRGRIEQANVLVLVDIQVQNLLQAMEAFAPPPAGQATLAPVGYPIQPARRKYWRAAISAVLADANDRPSKRMRPPRRLRRTGRTSFHGQQSPAKTQPERTAPRAACRRA